MDLGLENKVAIVAASSQGLGKAVAIGLAKEGTDLVITSRDSRKLQSVASELKKYGHNVLVVPSDLTKYEDVQHLVSKSIENYGQIDILVTNCGGPPSGDFLDFSNEDWKQAIDLNLMSTIYLCKEVIPYMIKQKNGRIIMITSVSVKQPIPGLILSNVVRGGVSGLAKSLSNELGKFNILVNQVCPGYTKTSRVIELADTAAKKQGQTAAEIMKKWGEMNTLGRLATPEEFANIVTFLASNQASHLTGTSIQIDGGYVKSLL